VVVFPFGWKIGFVVGFDIADAAGDQAFDCILLPSADMPRIRTLAINPHHGHDVIVQQGLAKFDRRPTAIVKRLDPLDLHGLELVDPELQIRAGGVIDAGRPMHAAAIILWGTGEFGEGLGNHIASPAKNGGKPVETDNFMH